MYTKSSQSTCLGRGPRSSTCSSFWSRVLGSASPASSVPSAIATTSSSARMASLSSSIWHGDTRPPSISVATSSTSWTVTIPSSSRSNALKARWRFLWSRPSSGGSVAAANSCRFRKPEPSRSAASKRMVRSSRRFTRLGNLSRPSRNSFRSRRPSLFLSKETKVFVASSMWAWSRGSCSTITLDTSFRNWVSFRLSRAFRQRLLTLRLGTCSRSILSQGDFRSSRAVGLRRGESLSMDCSASMALLLTFSKRFPPKSGPFVRIVSKRLATSSHSWTKGGTPASSEYAMSPTAQMSVYIAFSGQASLLSPGSGPQSTSSSAARVSASSLIRARAAGASAATFSSGRGTVSGGT
mmetsp:Transcript_81047/g.212779  ORF Transcript_81047/g.212779 Transcript_81047/m.212779 type:complete len:353 (-) Transcript_81047:178-1236(-)